MRFQLGYQTVISNARPSESETKRCPNEKTIYQLNRPVYVVSNSVNDKQQILSDFSFVLFVVRKC